MDDIERAVGNWHRVYGQLSVARENLRRAEPTLSGIPTAAVSALAEEVNRLLREEERAMRAIHEAFAQAKHRHPGSAAHGRPRVRR